MEKLLLDMQNISKSFLSVQALKNVNFQLKAGEIHALLGENGAGKSTLIKILGGIYTANKGDIYIGGEKKNIDSVYAAQQNGISIIHQELMLVSQMTVAENIFMGREICNRLFVKTKKMNKEAQIMLDSFDLPLLAEQKIGQLSIANQQMVEIIKAISFGAEIIVMDEPTSSLSEKEVLKLFEAILKLKKMSIGIIYISHRMSELDEITDRISILRDGSYIATVDTKHTTREELISLMVGRDLVNFYIKDSVPKDEIVLEVENISDGKSFFNISFNVKKGEILGFAGLVGAGRSETMQCLFGISQKTCGTVKLFGNTVLIKNVKAAMKAGFGLVPENRKKDGLYLKKNICFNACIEVLDSFIKGIFVDTQKEYDITHRYCTKMKVKTPSYSNSIDTLSGGNQQKVIIGRWLAANSQILILDEPTRGIDVSAKAEIYSIINELAKEGKSIILVSSELPEVINMCDRIVVMNHGRITSILEDDFTQERIMHFATMDITTEEK